jgi:hypothetical protein
VSAQSRWGRGPPRRCSGCCAAARHGQAAAPAPWPGRARHKRPLPGRWGRHPRGTAPTGAAEPQGLASHRGRARPRQGRVAGQPRAPCAFGRAAAPPGTGPRPGAAPACCGGPAPWPRWGCRGPRARGSAPPRPHLAGSARHAHRAEAHAPMVLSGGAVAASNRHSGGSNLAWGG